jgi:hypothetical protein
LKDLKELFSKSKGNYIDPTIQAFVISGTQSTPNNDGAEKASDSNVRADQQTTASNNDKITGNVDSGKDLIEPVHDDIIIATLDKIKLNYKRLFNKENHIKIFEFHLKNGTEPSQLFYDKFPKPFLPHSEKAIDEYNKIIKETQQKLMNCYISVLKEEIGIGIYLNRN